MSVGLNEINRPNLSTQFDCFYHDVHVKERLCISNEEKIHCEWDATSFVPPVTHR